MAAEVTRDGGEEALALERQHPRPARRPHRRGARHVAQQGDLTERAALPLHMPAYAVPIDFHLALVD